MQHLQPNTTLQGGKYRIERVLGQGGFGNTYIGYNTEFEETVAIKEFFMKGVTERDETTSVVSVSNADNVQQFEEQREKFKKEALRIRKLNNPHIVKVHDLFEENGTAYYVMDFVEGENLSQRLKRTGKPMAERKVREIFLQLLDALKAVHDAGMWHLDIKPANIMLDKEGNVKLIDFGASKQLNAQKGGATTSTAISYTNGYAPREQMEQSYDKFGPWTDIYALGATLYNLLTNKRPPMPSDIDDDISEDKHKALSFPVSTSGEMKKLVLQMMKTNRIKRPQNVSELMPILENLNDLEKVKENLSDISTIESEGNEATIIATLQNEEKTIIEKAIKTEERNEPEPVASSTRTNEYYEDKTSTFKKYVTIIFLAIIAFLMLFLGLKNFAEKNELYEESYKPAFDSLEIMLPKGSTIVARFPDEERADLYYLNSGILYRFNAKSKVLEEIDIGSTNATILDTKLSQDEKEIILTVRDKQTQKRYRLNTMNRIIDSYE